MGVSYRACATELWGPLKSADFIGETMTQVNGKLAVKDGKYTEALAGKVIRHKVKDSEK